MHGKGFTGRMLSTKTFVPKTGDSYCKKHSSPYFFRKPPPCINLGTIKKKEFLRRLETRSLIPFSTGSADSAPFKKTNYTCYVEDCQDPKKNYLIL
jgi:hypothetical protein